MARISAVDRTVAFIRSAIDAGTFRVHAPLPRREALARMAGVSPRTVSSAIARLKREGVVDSVQGRHPRLCAPPGERDDRARSGSEMPEQTGPSYAVAAARLRDDILAGRYKPGDRLPGRKQLQAHYQTTYYPLRRALALLVRQKVLRRHGVCHTVPAIGLARASIRIALLWFSDQPLLPSHHRDKSLIDALEIECRRNAVGFDKLIISQVNEGVIFRRHESDTPVNAREMAEYAGFVYLVSYGGCLNPAALAWLAAVKKPVSIHDWIDAAEPLRTVARSAQCVRTVSSTVPGFQTGRFLTGLGHRHLAFFAPLEEPHAMRRFEGIAEACRLAGPGSTVTPFFHRPRSRSFDLAAMARQRYKAFQPIERNHPGIPNDYSVGILDLGRTSWDIYGNATRFCVLKPLFEQALADPRITAWIGSEDSVALMAWSFLRSRGKKIPGEISVMGFDNTVSALDRELTSYDYDFPAQASVSLHYLLRSDLSQRIGKLARPEIEGFVIERRSTGRRA